MTYDCGRRPSAIWLPDGVVMDENNASPLSFSRKSESSVTWLCEYKDGVRTTKIASLLTLIKLVGAPVHESPHLTEAISTWQLQANTYLTYQDRGLIFLSLFEAPNKVFNMLLADAYQVMGLVRYSTTFEEVRSTYKRLCLRYHPDKQLDDPEKAHEVMVDINNAYKVVLEDVTSRPRTTPPAPRHASKTRAEPPESTPQPRPPKRRPKPPPPPPPPPRAVSHTEALRHWTKVCSQSSQIRSVLHRCNRIHEQSRLQKGLKESVWDAAQLRSAILGLWTFNHRGARILAKLQRLDPAEFGQLSLQERTIEPAIELWLSLLQCAVRDLKECFKKKNPMEEALEKEERTIESIFALYKQLQGKFRQE